MISELHFRTKVVISSHAPWSEYYVTPHYIAMLLGRRARVLFVEPPIRWHPGSPGFSLRRCLQVLAPNVRQVAPSIWALRPRCLPLGRIRGVKKLNAILIARQVLRALRLHDAIDPLLWLCDTENALVLRSALPTAPCVFHAIDYQVSEKDANAAVQLALTSDVVIASSREILASLPVDRKPSYLLPNAWLPWEEPAPAGPPPELQDLPKPYAGLIGTIGSTLDFDLLKDLAKSFQGSLVLIGEPSRGLPPSDARSLAALFKMPNVHHLGRKPTVALQQYIAAFHVCLAPYKQNMRVYSSSPLKVYQYLSFGKPVVSTPVAQLEDLEPLIYVARDRASFVRTVCEIVTSSENPEIIRKRQQFAAANTWEARWATLVDIFQTEPTLRVLAA